jgi:uncharacterized protein
MGHRYLELHTNPAVQAARMRWAGKDHYARAGEGPDRNDRLGPDEAAFIAERDGFYLGSVNPEGWPYIQFRGGPPGFLHVLDATTLVFADFGGNRQYITAGNVAENNRVALFLMDYLHRSRLKVSGPLSYTDSPEVLERLAMPGYPARLERAARIEVVGFDWNCQQHIPVRFNEAEVSAAVDPLHRRIAELEAENQKLRATVQPGPG